MFVDLGVLLDKGIRARNIGLRLVIIVIADEVLDRVIRKELFEFAVQLGGQGFVVGHHDGWALHGLNDFGNGVGLARPGYPQQGLVGQPVMNTLDQTLDGGGLIPGGGKRAVNDKFVFHGHRVRSETLDHKGLIDLNAAQQAF